MIKLTPGTLFRGLKIFAKKFWCGKVSNKILIEILFAQILTIWIVTGNFCNFLIIIQIISPSQLLSVGGGDKLRFLDFWVQNFEIQGLTLLGKEYKIKTCHGN